ncbi:MAG: chemotaxis protein CheV [Lachnospiraceae bacterium]|nr:chemotaxis protein CheV [Lachnospiraceae bacterium]
MADTKVLETTVEQNQMNQIEVLEFRLDGKAFGINIGKVREIIEYHPITPMPKTHPGIEGVFMPRDTMITAVDLKICLGIGESEKKGKYILTNFNNLNIAFHVDEVVGIHRIAWKDIMIPEATSSSYDNGNITGVVKVANRLMVIPDFETLMADINPEIGIKINDMDKLGDREYNEISVLVVEDSSLMNKLLLDALKQAGYHRLIHAENGQQAWNFMKTFMREGTLRDNIRCVITDIEMPIMDGFNLIKKMKAEKETSTIPIIIYTSMVNDDMLKKGKKLGVDSQLVKQEVV